jgi:hypothetical protein
MENDMTVTLNTEKLRADYFQKLEVLNLAEKAKNEDSKKHNGYIDRDEYRRLSDKKWRASLEVSAIYEFMRDYFKAEEVKVKRGEMTFTLNDIIYDIEKREIEVQLGWRTGKRTEWRMRSRYQNHDGSKVIYDGRYADTKTALIEDLNWKVQQDLISDILGPRPESTIKNS